MTTVYQALIMLGIFLSFFVISLIPFIFIGYLIEYDLLLDSFISFVIAFLVSGFLVCLEIGLLSNLVWPLYL